MIMKKGILVLLVSLGITTCLAQQQITLDLQQTIALANDSSLEAFRTKNMYLAGYWEYRTYKANRLPSLTLNMTPAQYNRDITKRYDSEQNLDIYRSQQSFYAYGNLAIRQNFDLTGGTFYLDTELGYMRSFGNNKSTQFTSVPVRVGYSQSLVGYNPFRWERKIEPLKYEKAKKEYLYNAEQVSEQATTYFFALAMAQAEYDLAKENAVSTDTLYRIGMQRLKIAAISRADLLTLKLDVVNARNTLQNAISSLKRAMFSLASFLNMEKNASIQVTLPGRPQTLVIPVDEALQAAQANNPQFLGLRQGVLEAERNVDKTRKESRFNASINASVGFNQVAEKFGEAYKHPMQQEMVSVSISVPLVDWGVRKGKYNMAKNNLNVVKTSARQNEIGIEEEVIMTVNDFNVQQDLVASAEEALDLAVLAYNETRQRFIIGKADINSLTLSLNRQQEAQRNYISALKDYWLNYYKIRKLTLHDFASGFSLSEKFDYTNINHLFFTSCLMKSASSFTLIVAFVCLALVGVALIPLLPVKLNPSRSLPGFTVGFSMPGTSSRVVEMEVTSKLESMLARIRGVKNLNSTSGNGFGRITVELDKHADVDAVRFEASTIIRQTWSQLPDGVSYPTIG